MRSQLGLFLSLICAVLLADTFWTAEAFAAEPSHPPLADPQALLQQGKPADFLAPAIAATGDVPSARAAQGATKGPFLSVGTFGTLRAR